jgi:hypothetical protein
VGAYAGSLGDSDDEEAEGGGTNAAGQPRGPRDVAAHDRLAGQLKWNWSQEEKGYAVSLFCGDPSEMQIRCRPDPNKTDPVTGRKIHPPALSLSLPLYLSLSISLFAFN